jgi:hypothetical protein
MSVTVLEAAGVDCPDVVRPDFELAQNSPNPFVCETVISFELDAAARVDLSIHNVRGQLVGRPISDAWMPSARHHVVFKGENLSPGIYYYRLTAGDRVRTKRMVLLSP